MVSNYMHDVHKDCSLIDIPTFIGRVFVFLECERRSLCKFHTNLLCLAIRMSLMMGVGRHGKHVETYVGVMELA